jgi:hypothetical protein
MTRPKTDDWLVQTVGGLAAVIGATLLVGTQRSQPGREIITLSVLSALGFSAVDTVFVLLGVISRIYLVDVVVQIVVIVALAVTSGQRNRKP